MQAGRHHQCRGDHSSSDKPLKMRTALKGPFLLPSTLGWGLLGSRRGHLALLKETLTTIDGPSLGWFEGDCRNLSTLRTSRFRFHSQARSVERLISLRFAVFTPFRFIAEILGCEEQLLSCRKNKFSSAVYTNKGSVLVFHGILRSVRHLR
jgi:hypothetical protein